MRVWERALGRGVGQESRGLPMEQFFAQFGAGGGFPMMGMNTTMQGDQEERPDGTFGSYVQQAYKTNGPVFALVLARMSVFSQGRFQWQRWDGGQPIDTFGSTELSLLERPWRGGTSADLLAHAEQDVSLSGNHFVRRIRRGRRGATGDRLARLRPDWVTIVLGSDEDADHPGDAADTEVVGYLYKPPDRQARLFSVDEVAHYAPIPDPEANFRGMSWITPVVRDLLGDKASSTHKLKFFENAATPNLAIKFDPKVTADQVREFKELIEADHTGVWNAYKNLYLGGGADPVVVGKDFKQLDFAVTQGHGESRLAQAAGVPAIIPGFPEGLQAATYSNYQQARRHFGDVTLSWLWLNVAASYEVLVDLPTPSEGVQLAVDRKHIPFLREDAKDAAEIFNMRARATRTLIDGGFEPETVTAAVDAMDVQLLVHSGKTSVQLHDPDKDDDGGGDDDSDD